MMAKRMAGTPPGQQRFGRVKAGFPASTNSLRFLNVSFTQAIKVGLLRSATRKVGCAAVLLGTNGWATSEMTGPGPLLGGRKLLSIAIQPTPFREKSGVLVPAIAAALAPS